VNCEDLMKEIKSKHSFFYNYTLFLSIVNSSSNERTPELVVDLLFKKKKKIEKSKKIKNKQRFLIMKNFQEFLPKLLLRRKKTRRALPISHKKTQKIFSVGAHSEILACKTET